MPSNNPWLIPTETGAIIGKAREGLPLTRDQVAEEFGVDKSYIGNLEGGQHRAGRSNSFPRLVRGLRLSSEDVGLLNPGTVRGDPPPTHAALRGWKAPEPRWQRSLADLHSRDKPTTPAGWLNASLKLNDVFDDQETRHAETGDVTDMPRLARALGKPYHLGQASVATPTGEVLVCASGPRQERQSDAAHELAHSLADEGGYTRAIRSYHASVSNMDFHLELLADHGADRLPMPDYLVISALKRYGRTGEAVWRLHEEAGVSLREALRRVVDFDPDVRVGGFVSLCGRITEAASHRSFLPFWWHDRVPEPHILTGPGISMFPIPGKRGGFVGLVVVGD